MKRNIISTIMILGLIITGCGYKIAITGMKSSFSVYIKSITNFAEDIDAGNVFEDEIKYYLSSINALAKPEKADYTAEFTLLDLSDSSASSNSSSAFISIKMHILLKDKKGDTVMDRNFTGYDNYDNTDSMSQTTTNRDDAIKVTLDKMLLDFRNELESK